MSKNTDKIRKALTAKGYVVGDLDWSPISSAMIMSGPEGGWYVTFDVPDNDVEYEEYNPFGYTIMGYNVQEVLDEIATLPILKEVKQ